MQKAINPDLLFVQNQVNRPTFTRGELALEIRSIEAQKNAVEVAEKTFAARPFLSPRELVVMTRLAKRGHKFDLVRGIDPRKKRRN